MIPLSTIDLDRAIRGESIVKLLVVIMAQLLALLFVLPLCTIMFLATLQTICAGAGGLVSIWIYGACMVFFAVSFLITLVLEYLLIRVTVMHVLIILSTYQHGEKQARTEQRAMKWRV